MKLQFSFRISKCILFVSYNNLAKKEKMNGKTSKEEIALYAIFWQMRPNANKLIRNIVEKNFKNLKQLLKTNNLLSLEEIHRNFSLYSSSTFASLFKNTNSAHSTIKTLRKQMCAS